MDREILSVVEDQGLYANLCGYCKSTTRTSIAFGLWAHSLSPYDYQELLDKSWRRSGMFLYRPEVEDSCCAAYTIRLKVDLFKMSKEHRRTMHHMQRYIDGTYAGPASQNSNSVENNENSEHEMSKMDVCCNERKARMDHKELGEMDYTSKLLTTSIYHALKDCVSFGEYPADMEFPIIKVAQNHRLNSKNGNDVTYTCNVAFRCAAEILKHKNNTRIISKYPVHIEDAHKKLAELLADSMASKLQKFESISHIKVEASNGHINFKVTRNDDAGSSTINGLRHVRRSNPVSNTSISTATYVSRQCNGEVHTKHKLEIRTKRSSFDVEEFALYRRYQTIIHHESEDDVTEGAYRRFLVDTPLTFLMPSEYGSAFCGFGSFHQQYLIDEQLVAVGVIDILPSCVSSNYFFWDPDLAFLSLGKYSALREIQLVHDLKLSCPSLEYYYLGHYIHSCPKMHYKVAFRPSELLCPVRMQWVPFDLARPLLDKQHSSCLSDGLPENAQESNPSVEHVYSKNAEGSRRATGTLFNPNTIVNDDTLRAVLLKINDQYIRFANLQDWAVVPQELMNALLKSLQRYTKIVGARLAAKMAYVLTK